MRENRTRVEVEKIRRRRGSEASDCRQPVYHTVAFDTYSTDTGAKEGFKLGSDCDLICVLTALLW